MKTWEQYLESKKSKAEKAEEKNGLDLDHDLEKHEPKDHQIAVKKAKKKMLEFFEDRKAGAQRIANEARSKGGAAQLTAWHFAAKAQPYSEVLAAIRSNRDETYFLNKCYQLVDKLKFKKLKQQDFQKIMGQLEVWGEAVSELFGW